MNTAVFLMFFAFRTCLGAEIAPKSPQASIFEASLVNIGPFFMSSSPFLVDFFHSVLHLLWVEGATENIKQHITN